MRGDRWLGVAALTISIVCFVILMYHLWAGK
jgi:hypothetical protein